MKFDEIKKLESLDSQCLDKNVANLIQLQHLTENSVLHMLRIRFCDGQIYSFVSSILIAVNPFHEYPIYDTDSMDLYRKTTDKRTLPPHIFVTADQAYDSLLLENQSQCLIISGESGSGKTESIKLVLKYITHISRKAMSSNHQNIQEQILQANPVMEAFGNAKTSRNNNSSRFGKLITLRFSCGAIDEAGIISYLLEKCRVAHHQEGERNFHIFYQLIAATLNDSELATQLGMTNSNEDYNYASREEVGSVSTVNDLKGFHELNEAMKILGLSEMNRKTVFRIVAGILHLGNIGRISPRSSSNCLSLC
jgi:myosin heavy subunit